MEMLLAEVGSESLWGLWQEFLLVWAIYSPTFYGDNQGCVAKLFREIFCDNSCDEDVVKVFLMLLRLSAFLSFDPTFSGVGLCGVLLGVSSQALVLKTEAFIRKGSGSGVSS